MQQLMAALKEGLRILWAGIRVLAVLSWSALRPVLMTALQVVAALIVLFEEWGWKPLSDALAWLARFRVVARLEGVISRLPPYPSLFVFALPTVFLFPLKLVAMWLLAQGKVMTATGLFAAAKVASTALVARLFMLTRPALLQIGWFARAYHRFMPWKDRLFAQIRASWVWRYGRMVKTRVRQETRRAWARWKPLATAWLARSRVAVRTWWARFTQPSG